MSDKRRGSRDHHQPPETYLEVNNPAIYSVLEPRPAKHLFEGDEHGHERHDTIPAEEEWVEDELEPEEQHNPEKP